MSSVDSRIVTMKFDNAQFERGVGTTMGSISKLKNSLDFSGSAKGLSDLSGAAKGVDLGSINDQTTGISKGFIALSTIAVTALSKIASAALDTGANLVKSVSGLQAMKDGFSDYELKIGATQTIMAGTGLGIKEVSKHLKDLDIYADKTIYSLSDMTSNIGKFTNAGVKLPLAVASLKGVAQVAALSGANSNEAARAMYNLGQAIGQGHVKLMDWRSVELANMGTKEFKEELIKSAVAMGTLKKASDGTLKTQKGTVVTAENFTSTLQDQWLTADALTTTLKRYSDENTAIGKKATKAAQEVKTFSMLMETLGAAAGTGWTDTFEILLGNLPEATKLFTSISESVGGFIGRSADARNAMLKDWKKLGGRNAAIEAITNVFKALAGVLVPIRQAFRDIFPRTTGQELYNFTDAVRNFTEKLIPAKETSENLRRTFKGLFAVFGIGVEIIKGIIGYFVGFFSLLSGGGGVGSVTVMTASIGDLLVKLHEWLVEGGKISDFFAKINEGRAAVLGPIIKAFGVVARVLAGLFTTGVNAGLEWFMATWKRLTPVVSDFGNTVQSVVGEVKSVFTNLMTTVGPMFAEFGGILSSLFAGGVEGGISGISAALSAMKPILQDIGAAIQDAFGFLMGMAGSAGSGLGAAFDIGDETSVAKAGIDGVKSSLKATVGVGEQVKGSWDSVVDAFKAVGTFLQPVYEGIKNIFSSLKDKLLDFVKGMGIEDGLAVVNTGFFIALYMMFRKFIKKMGGVADALTDSFNSLTGVFDQTTKNLKTMQTDVKSNIILKIAAALALLAVALLILSRIPLKQLGQSLGAVAGLLIMLTIAMQMINKMAADNFKDAALQAANMAAISVAMVGLGIALLAFAGAVAILGNMDTKTLIKGIGATAAVLAVVIGASALLSKSGGAGAMLVASAALLILSVALTALSGALLLYARIDGKELANGGLKVAAMLVALGLAMRAFPPNILATAAALFIVSSALVLLAGSLKVLGGMGAWELTKALIALAASLVLIALAMNAMSAAVSGAAAMLLFAAALAVMVPSIVTLGNLDLATIGKALLALAGIFTVLGLAAFILAPLTPIIIALAGGIALLGLAALAVGAGLLMFSIGLATLAASGAAGAAVLTAAIISIAQLIPLIMHQFGLGIIAFAKVLAHAGPPLMKAFATVLNSLLDAVIKVTPKIGRAISTLLREVLRIIRAVFPDLVQTGIQLIMNLLTGISKNIGKIANTATDIVVKWMAALGRNLPRIVNAGFKMIISFINGITRAINKNSKAMGEAGGRLAVAIARGMANGLFGMASEVWNAAQNLAKKALDGIKKVFGIKSPSRETFAVGKYVDQGLANGLDKYSKVVESSAEGVADNALDTMKVSMSKISDAVSGDVDMNPVIAPVLDLTKLQNEASKIGTMLDSNTITAGVSFERATSISADQEAARNAAASDAELAAQGPSEFKIEQNNYSPKALDPVTIYRNTKSAISLAKEALNA